MKKEEQLLNDLTELIKETQKNKVDWKVDCQTTEYNDLQEKPVHEEEGERWIVDECFVSYECTHKGTDFLLITYEQIYKIPEAKMLEGMYIAAGVGQVIAERACIAGAQGGCQAEIGSASCMAAAAITYIRGGSTKQVFDAGAFALKSLLGLVCDPLGGLVEVPCIKRNVIGSVNAITASDMAMAEIESKVPLDEVIDAMAEVGDLLPCSLKETSQAGLAQTETGKKYMPES